ncbi:MAG: ABC transporter permease [Eubacteriales bacterium]
MRRVVLAIARRSFAKGTRLKTQMSKASLWVSLLFVMFFILYLMSYAITPDTSGSSESAGKTLLVNPPHSFEVFLSEKFADVPEVAVTAFIREKNGAYYDFLTYQDKLSKGQAELVIVFPEDFDRMTAALSGENRPRVLTYYDPSDPNSKSAHDWFIKNILTDYGDAIQAEYGRISTSAPAFNVVLQEFSGTHTEEGILGSKSIITRMILPLVLFISVMYACMEAGTVSIAGEKERGTFAAILLTPARRGEIVLGNALGIVLHAMIPATIISILLTAVFGFFSAGTIMYLLVLCLSLSLLLTALVLIISILNRSILAAQASFLPLFFILLIVCITAMQKQGTPVLFSYLVPFYGHYYGIEAALNGTYSVSLLFMLCGICAVLTVLLLLAADKLLHVERFTTSADDNQDVQKEIRRRNKDRIMLQKETDAPQNIVYNYHPKRSRPAVSLLTYHLLLPLYLLSIFQTAALIIPLLSYIRSDESTSFFTELSQSGGNPAFTISMVLRLLAKFMQTKPFVIAMGVSYVLVIAVYFLIIRVFEKQPMSTAGLSLSGNGAPGKALLSYMGGLVLGFAMMLGVFLLLLLTGQIHVTGFGLDSSAAGLFLIYILMWVPQGASEELMFRGYMMPRLSARFGRAAAVLLTSLSFCVLHIGNAGFSVIAFANLILIAVFFALLSLYTQQIWTVCAAHSIWNFAQGNLFGLEVSGTQSAARLIQTSYSADNYPLLTGGDFGPEGGLIVTGVIVLCLLILVFIRHKLDKAAFS